ncbi:MAG: hypothetical protein ACE5FI_15475, partial [Anaerolineales bacterium]
NAWLRGNAQVLAEQGLERGRDALLQRFDREVRPQLAGIGLDAAAVNTLRGQIEQGLLQLTGHLHLDAMTQLLEGVELRRYQIQSPLRKLWRRLRNSSFPW